MAKDVLKEYLLEYSGNIMIFSGIVLFVVGLFFTETFGSPVSAIAFFFGITFFTFGLFARLGLFYSKLNSLDGLGTILICVSVALFALSFSLIVFQAVKSVTYIPVMGPGGRITYSPQINTYRPYAGFSLNLIAVGLPILFVALIAKGYSARR